MASVSTAHRVYLDGVPRMGGGVVSLQPDEIVEDGTRWLHEIPDAGDELEVLIQVANADYRKGGLRRAPVLGRADHMQSFFQRRLLADAVLVLMMLGVGAYQLGLFALRPGLTVHLPFGLMCTALGLRATLSRDGQIANMVFPDLTWGGMIRVEYLLTWLAIGLCIGWQMVMFPRESRHWLNKALLVSIAGWVVFTLAAPVSVFTASTLPLQATAALAGVAMLFGLMRAVARRTPGSPLILISAVMFAVGIGMDIWVAQSPGTVSSDFSTLAFIGLMLAESVRLALNYTRSFQVIELLGQELRLTNADLEATNQAILRFVPQEFLEVIGRRSIREVFLGDHSRQDVEVLFLDIRGFTPLIESMPPEEGFAFLNAFLSGLVPEIKKHGGFVNHFLGDAILAIFHDGADEAVAGALALQAALARLNRDRDQPIEVGLGIHSGPLMMGVIGSEDRLDSNVVGDTVNLASRLEGMTRIYSSGLLLSGATVSRLAHPEALRLRELDCVRAKGRQEPVHIFEVMTSLSPERAEQVEATRSEFLKGRTLYREGRFAEAAEVFASAAVLAPLDPAAHMYERRCRLFAEKPPNAWDGVTVLRRK